MFKFTKESMNTVAGRVGAGAKKNAPTLMLIGATIGFGLTIYEVLKAAPKVHDICAERKEKLKALEDEAGTVIEENDEGQIEEKRVPVDPYKVRAVNIDTLICLSKVLAKPASTAVATVGLMWGANYIHIQRNVTMSKKLADTVAVADISKEALEKYKLATKENVGEDTEKKISDAADQKLINDTYDPNRVLNSGRGDVIFLDKWTGRYFWGTVAQIKNSVADVRMWFDSGEFIEANVLYDYWGLEPCGFGEKHGWMPGQIDLYVKMNETAKLPDGRPCIVLDYDYIDAPVYDG